LSHQSTPVDVVNISTLTNRPVVAKEFAIYQLLPPRASLGTLSDDLTADRAALYFDPHILAVDHANDVRASDRAKAIEEIMRILKCA